jgi:hypothetical protein
MTVSKYGRTKTTFKKYLVPDTWAGGGNTMDEEEDTTDSVNVTDEKIYDSTHLQQSSDL